MHQIQLGPARRKIFSSTVISLILEPRTPQSLDLTKWAMEFMV
jgi:hypothetical protein